MNDELEISDSTRDREGVDGTGDSASGTGEPGGDENVDDTSEGWSCHGLKVDASEGSKLRRERAVGYDEVRGWGRRGSSEALNV